MPTSKSTIFVIGWGQDNILYSLEFRNSICCIVCVLQLDHGKWVKFTELHSSKSPLIACVQQRDVYRLDIDDDISTPRTPSSTLIPESSCTTSEERVGVVPFQTGDNTANTSKTIDHPLHNSQMINSSKDKSVGKINKIKKFQLYQFGFVFSAYLLKFLGYE